MTYYSKETLKKLYDIDLYTYLINYEPDEIIKINEKTYCTKEHDSLRISNGLWYWFSQGVGGRSAIDFLKIVRGYEFLDAVEFLLEKTKISPISYETYMQQKKVNINKKLILPEKNNNCDLVIKYLSNRGISKNIILELIDKNYIYEDKKYHNVVFVGYDKYNNPKYANIRGINSDFKGDAYGSDKNYSFRLINNKCKSRVLHLFESAIDLLSYVTLLEINNKNWHEGNYLSLAGVYKPSLDIKQSKIPKVLENYLKENKNIKFILLHLDNDRTGKEASKGLEYVLQEKYIVYNYPPKMGKDYNDYLLLELSKIKKNEKER